MWAGSPTAIIRGYPWISVDFYANIRGYPWIITAPHPLPSTASISVGPRARLSPASPQVCLASCLADPARHGLPSTARHAFRRRAAPCRQHECCRSCSSVAHGASAPASASPACMALSPCSALMSSTLYVDASSLPTTRGGSDIGVRTGSRFEARKRAHLLASPSR